MLYGYKERIFLYRPYYLELGRQPSTYNWDRTRPVRFLGFHNSTTDSTRRGMLAYPDVNEAPYSVLPGSCQGSQLF